MSEPLFKKLDTSYCQSLVDALRIPNPQDFQPEVVCRVLYMPSFHGEAMIEVTGTKGRLQVSLATLQTHWYRWKDYGILGPHWLPDFCKVPRPFWRQATREIEPVAAGLFMDMVSRGLPESSGGWITINDGMPVYLWFREPDGKVKCRTFNGSGEDPVASRFSADVLRLAIDTLTEPVSQSVLADIRDYLKDDL